MAEKKATKAPAKKAVAEKSLDEQLRDARNNLLEARKSLAAGELVNPRVINEYRKEIARILTKVNAEKENN